MDFGENLYVVNSSAIILTVTSVVWETMLYYQWV